VTKSRLPPFAAEPSAVTVLAPAKINLILRVLDRRSDGYHNLWSVMHTVGLEDEVSIHLNPGHADIRLQCDSQSLSADKTNLVYRAAVAVLEHSKRTAGLDIALAKRIPMGAGLGGGSSDAAATIVGLNRLLNLGWSQAMMASVGQTLGSDVPFFFFSPCAIVSGRGEQVKAVHMAESRWIVLVNPGFPVETKWAYQQLSSARASVDPIPAALAAVKQAQQVSWDQMSKESCNDFEAPVFAAHPVLQKIKLRLLAEGADMALLSGSGATVFGVFSDEHRARHAAVILQTNPEFKTFVVPTAIGPLRSTA
jgi:4-diphosphocytidyl-2-C-methyl-D-erythritol kinase